MWRFVYSYYKVWQCRCVCIGKRYSLKCKTSKGTCDGAHGGEVASTVAAQREGSSGWV